MQKLGSQESSGVSALFCIYIEISSRFSFVFPKYKGLAMRRPGDSGDFSQKSCSLDEFFEVVVVGRNPYKLPSGIEAVWTKRVFGGRFFFDYRTVSNFVGVLLRRVFELQTNFLNFRIYNVNLGSIVIGIKAKKTNVLK